METLRGPPCSEIVRERLCGSSSSPAIRAQSPSSQSDGISMHGWLRLPPSSTVSSKCGIQCGFNLPNMPQRTQKLRLSSAAYHENRWKQRRTSMRKKYPQSVGNFEAKNTVVFEGRVDRGWQVRYRTYEGDLFAPARWKRNYDTSVIQPRKPSPTESPLLFDSSSTP